MELGITTFVEAGLNPLTGEFVSHGERLRRVVEEIKLADAVGIDIFGIGEHHRNDYAASAPEVILAAAATQEVAAKGVLFLEPLKASFPALAQEIAFPSQSVNVTRVLL